MILGPDYRLTVAMHAHIQDALSAARSALRDGKPAAAVRVLADICALHPNNAQLVKSLGAALFANGELPAARMAFERAIALNPELATAHLHLAQVLNAQGERDLATRAYFRAVSRAQMRGDWRSAQTTPAHLHTQVLQAMDQIEQDRPRLLGMLLAPLIEAYGLGELKRVSAALAGYLQRTRLQSGDARQHARPLERAVLECRQLHLDAFTLLHGNHANAKGVGMALGPVAIETLDPHRRRFDGRHRVGTGTRHRRCPRRGCLDRRHDAAAAVQHLEETAADALGAIATVDHVPADLVRAVGQQRRVDDDVAARIIAVAESRECGEDVGAGRAVAHRCECSRVDGHLHAAAGHGAGGCGRGVRCERPAEVLEWPRPGLAVDRRVERTKRPDGTGVYVLRWHQAVGGKSWFTRPFVRPKSLA